jgi:hypothetical protein
MLYSKIQTVPNHAVMSPEEASAPDHPLQTHLNFPLPSIEQATLPEIRQVQLRDRIPGLVKRLLPFDGEMTWEYWWAVPGRMLLPEDVDLLIRDRQRVETILAKLLWLFGGYYFEQSSPRQGDLQPFHEWQQILQRANQLGFNRYLLDIDYLPIAIKPFNSPQTPVLDLPPDCLGEYVAVEPAHWHIEFFQLQPISGGYDIQEPKPLCSCQIWTGKPFLRSCYTEDCAIRYDLWIGKPLDITIPPWRYQPEPILDQSSSLTPK